MEIASQAIAHARKLFPQHGVFFDALILQLQPLLPPRARLGELSLRRQR